MNQQGQYSQFNSQFEDWDQESDFQTFQSRNHEAPPFKKKTTNSTRAYSTKQFQPEIRSSSQELYSCTLIEEFELSTFKVRQYINKDKKTVQCPKNNDTHNRKHCLYFHSDSDRRRNPDSFTYKCDFCFDVKLCQQDELCLYSHNKVEQLYHPNRYKTKYCQSRGQCEYGKYCSFAHSDIQILIPQKLHKMNQDTVFWIYAYKTVWCPYIEFHDRGICVYAHNAQDFRRDPRVFEYQAIDCGEWNKSQNVTSYKQGGCKLMENCKSCHGWKENEYHPQMYKTKKCSNGIKCQKKERECAYYHNDLEKRVRSSQNNTEWPNEDSIKYKPKVVALQDNFNELISAKKMPIKRSSNFNGPIIPIIIVNEEPDSIIKLNHKEKLLRQKIEMGQPFEVFSSTVTQIPSNDSRKMSDVSYETTTYNIQQSKKTRTAPVTPDQQNNNNNHHNHDLMLLQVEKMLQIQQQQQYSLRFIDEMTKKAGSQITYALQQNDIQENVLMLSSENKLRKILNFLSPQQVLTIINVIDELKIKDDDDNMLKETMVQNKNQVFDDDN